MLSNAFFQLLLGLFDFLFKSPGTDALGLMAQNDGLLHAVGRCHPHPVMAAQLIGGALNVGVRRLRLLGVDNKNIVDLLRPARIALPL